MKYLILTLLISISAQAETDQEIMEKAQIKSHERVVKAVSKVNADQDQSQFENDLRQDEEDWLRNLQIQHYLNE